MQQLTGLDAAFLALETANSTGHVGGVCILDPKDAPAPLTLAGSPRCSASGFRWCRCCGASC